MDSQSLWQVTGHPTKQREKLQGEHQTDVLIIGAGYAGLSVAYHLQQKGCQSLVLEEKSIGDGASGRNGGQILVGYKDSMLTIAKKWGEEAAKDMLQLSLEAIKLTEELVEEESIDCAFKRSGHLVAAYKPSHLEYLKKEQVEMEQLFSYPIQILEKEELQAELNSDFYYGGAIDEQSCSFHPYNFALGLAEAVEKRGGKIFEASKAISWQRENQHFVVQTAEGVVKATHLVIATNGYTDHFHSRVFRSVIPVESISIATEVLEQELLEKLIPKDRVVFDTKNLLFYFRRTPDGRIAFGGSGRAANKKDASRLFEDLELGLHQVFPELLGKTVEYRWGGKVGFTRQMLPFVGQVEQGIYSVFGCSGHGASMFTMLGKIIAQSILQEERQPRALENIPLKSIPFRNQHSKIVNLLKYYYKYLDSKAN